MPKRKTAHQKGKKNELQVLNLVLRNRAEVKVSVKFRNKITMHRNLLNKCLFKCFMFFTHIKKQFFHKCDLNY